MVPAGAHLDPHGWRAGTSRVLANAVLVLLAFEVVSLGSAAAQVITAGVPPPVTTGELVLLLSAFVLFRWIFVLPGLLLVLAGLEYVARRVPHGRALTLIVAFGPMVAWQLTQASGDTSGFVVILGLTAVLFSLLARVPTHRQRRAQAGADGLSAAEPVVVGPR